MSSRAKRFACSLWAQQGSNLRPLGEQRHVYQGVITPTDLALRGVGVYPGGASSTPKTDEKVTADLGRRIVDTAAAFAVAAVIYPAVVWAYRSERGQR